MGIPKATPAHWAARGGKWQILQCLKEALDRWCNDVRCEPQLGGCHICFVGKRNTWTQLAGTSFRKLVAGCWNIHVSNWHYPGGYMCHDWNLTGPVLQQWKELYKFALKPWLPNLTPAKGRCESGGRGSALALRCCIWWPLRLGVLTIIDFRGEGKKNILFHCPLKLMTFLKLLKIDEFRFL